MMAGNPFWTLVFSMTNLTSCANKDIGMKVISNPSMM